MEKKNQIHRNVRSRMEYTVHEMVVDGVTLRECMEKYHPNNNARILVVSHSRWIGDKKFAVKQTVLDGQFQFESAETNIIDHDEIKEFKKEWQEKSSFGGPIQYFGKSFF